MCGRLAVRSTIDRKEISHRVFSRFQTGARVGFRLVKD